MIDGALYPFSILTSVMVLVVIISMLRAERFKERHAIVWLFAGFTSLLLSLFPGFIFWVAGQIGFTIPSNLIFFASIVLLVLVALQSSTELSTLEEKTRILAERSAVAHIRLDKIEDNLSRRDQGPATSSDNQLD